MVKPLVFKGDSKSKKRKHREAGSNEHKSTALTTTDQIAVSTDEDDSWVTAESPSDVTGPVIFVLPTDPPTCIACDANGKVFTSEIENMIEGDPTTAEPHDVRQVWIANRAAGTESITFKGHHGR
jgi:protein FRG1